MRSEKWRGHVVTCALSAFVSAIFSYGSYRVSSWGIWRKTNALSNCLPLPPPIGCSEHYNAREILGDKDKDFEMLCLITLGLDCFITLFCFFLLAGDDNRLAQMDKNSLKKGLFLTFILSGVLGVLTCLIATFRINIISTMQRRQGLFVAGGMTPTYSTSIYMTSVCSLLSLFGSYVSNQIGCASVDSIGRTKLSKTIKQHMARNIMYPDDQRATKMVTFSSMSPDMEEAAAEVCVKGVMKYSLEEDIAEHIKQNFEQRFGPTWHCAVGANFGSAVHHHTNEYIEVAMPQLSIMLFRCNEASSANQNKPISNKL